jgi:hypothetical protein
MKRTKNSRFMHMVFNVQSGTVEVRVHENEFTIHKHGIWQVPRGTLTSFFLTVYLFSHFLPRVASIFCFPPFARLCTTAVSLCSTPDGVLHMPSRVALRHGALLTCNVTLPRRQEHAEAGPGEGQASRRLRLRSEAKALFSSHAELLLLHGWVHCMLQQQVLHHSEAACASLPDLSLVASCRLGRLPRAWCATKQRTAFVFCCCFTLTPFWPHFIPSSPFFSWFCFFFSTESSHTWRVCRGLFVTFSTCVEAR